MSEPVITIKLEEIGSAAQKMVEHHIRHLPVLDSKFNLIGVLSSRDLLPAVGEIQWKPKITVASDVEPVQLHLVTPGVGTEEILRNIIPQEWPVVIWESIERIINGSDFLNAISTPGAVVFADLDLTSATMRQNLFKTLISTMKNVQHPHVFICYSGEKLSAQEEKQLEEISKKTQWHVFEKPIAIARLLESMAVINGET